MPRHQVQFLYYEIIDIYNDYFMIGELRFCIKIQYLGCRIPGNSEIPTKSALDCSKAKNHMNNRVI